MNRAQALLAPECNDVAKAMQISGMLEIVVVAIVFIMLVFAAAYNNMVHPTSTEDIAKKEKYINGLIIASAVIITIALFLGIWHVYTSGRAKKCIVERRAS